MKNEKKKMPRIKSTRITEEKLYSPLNLQGLKNLDYIILAKKIAKDLYFGKEIDENEVAYVRDKAVSDRKNLKGDFVIMVFLEMYKIVYKTRNFGNGKSMVFDEDLTRAIFKNDLTKKMTVKEFCQERRMTRSRYYRILSADVKHENVKEKILSVKNEVFYGIK